MRSGVEPDETPASLAPTQVAREEGRVAEEARREVAQEARAGRRRPRLVFAPSTFSLRTGREEVAGEGREARGQARREEVRRRVERDETEPHRSTHRSPAKKAASPRKPAAKKSPAKPASKAKSPAKKKTAAKKSPAKKPAAKKSPAKRSTRSKKK